jgi:hypothetical protein
VKHTRAMADLGAALRRAGQRAESREILWLDGAARKYMAKTPHAAPAGRLSSGQRPASSRKV